MTETKTRQYFKIRCRVLWPLSLTLLSFAVMFVVIAYNYLQQDIRASEAQEIAFVDNEFAEIVEQRTQVLLAIAQQLIQLPALQQAMLTGDRERLYEAARPIYAENSSSQGITHFSFHTPGAVNFLRVHFPARHGDLITRHTMATALKTDRVCAGLELGTLGTFTLRVVMPWVVAGRPLGYIELGVEVDHLLRLVQQRTQANLAITLDKSHLKRSDWQMGLEMLDRQGDWDQLPNEVIADVIFPFWDSRQVMAGLEHLAGTEGEIYLNLGQERFRGQRLPLRDVSGEKVGTFLVFIDVTEKIDHFQKLVVWTVLLSALAGGGLFVVSYWVLGRADRQLAGVHRQLTAELALRRQVEEELRQSHAELEERVRERTASLESERAFLQRLIDGLPDPVLVIDLNHRILRMNRIARQSMPEEEGAAAALTCHQLSHCSDQPCSGVEHPCPLQQVRESGEPVVVLHQHLDGDGDLRICQVSAAPLYDKDGSLAGIIETSRDVTELLETREALASNREMIMHMVSHDPLTDLPNRAYCLDRLPHSLARAGHRQEHAALLFLDLDRFKKINDTLGHDIGDLVLQVLAQRLKNGIRPEDLLARFGGDEFVIFLQNITEPTQVIRLIHRLLAELEAGIEVEGHRLHLTTSIGISFFPNDADSVEELIKLAEVAMYRAKEEGRNTCQFYTPDMDARARDLLQLESELRLALEKEQFLLHYQPQIDLKSGRLIGFEALVRWHHPERGLVSPADFIPLAEESGLILDIGEWVLREACRQNLDWQRRGFPAVRMAVNISARQFMQSDLVGQVTQLMKTTSIFPGGLELEITESSIMSNVNLAVETMHELNRMGVLLAIDDFGSGYSSLSYLKKFPISKLKIDRSFVADVTNDSNDAAIARSVIALGKSMSLEVIAEGIETGEQLAFLLENGCLQGQGYWFSRPLAAADVEMFFSDRAGG